MLLRLQFLGRDAAGSNDRVQMANDYQILHLKPALVATARTLRNTSCPEKAGKNTFAGTPKWEYFAVSHIGYHIYSGYFLSILSSICHQSSSSQNHTTWCWPDGGLESSQAAAALLGLQGPPCCSSSSSFTQTCTPSEGALAEVRPRGESLVDLRMPNIWGRALPHGQPESIYLLLIIRQITRWTKVV